MSSFNLYFGFFKIFDFLLRNENRRKYTDNADPSNFHRLSNYCCTKFLDHYSGEYENVIAPISLGNILFYYIFSPLLTFRCFYINNFKSNNKYPKCEKKRNWIFLSSIWVFIISFILISCLFNEWVNKTYKWIDTEIFFWFFIFFGILAIYSSTYIYLGLITNYWFILFYWIFLFFFAAMTGFIIYIMYISYDKENVEFIISSVICGVLILSILSIIFKITIFSKCYGDHVEASSSV